MKIKKIISQDRRDFQAIYECENCGYEMESHGYDDANFHFNVIPKMKCHQCEKVAPPDAYESRATRYPEGMQV